VEGLTRTESLIVEKYLSRTPPPKAKELAAELGVSVKTVYKALYKYRKLYGQLLPEADPRSSTAAQAGVSVDRIEELIEVLRGLKLSIDRLNESICRLLEELGGRAGVGATAQMESCALELPSFVKDNPWLKLIERLPQDRGWG